MDSPLTPTHGNGNGNGNGNGHGHPPAPRPSTATPPPSSPPTPADADVRRLFAIFRKRKWQVALVALCLLVPVAVGNFLAQPLYRSTARLNIEPGSAKVLPYAAITDANIQNATDYDLYIATQQEVLTGPTLLNRAIALLDERHSAALSPAARANVMDRLEVRRVSGSQVLTVSFVAESPAAAAEVANTIVDAYLELHKERRLDETRAAAEFLEQQITTLRGKAADAEREMLAYAREQGILNVESSSANTNLQWDELADLTSAITFAQQQYLAAQADADHLQQAPDDELLAREPSRALDLLTAQLADAQAKLRLLDDHGPQSKTRVRAQDEVLLIAQLIERERKLALDAIRNAARDRARTAEVQYRQLEDRLESQKVALATLNESKTRYDELRREVQTNAQLQAGLLERLKQARINVALEHDNIHVIDRAAPADWVYRPRKALNLSLAAVIGLALGVGLALFLEHVGHSVKSVGDAEDCGAPVLAAIPALPAAARLGLRDLPALPPADADAGRVNVTPRMGHRQHAATWWARESYRALGASLMLSHADRPPHVMLVTSATPREGKTTTVALLGEALAESGASTCLLDLDLRTAALTNLYRANDAAGLSAFLSGNADLEAAAAPRPTGTPGLALLPAGPTSPNPLALLNSDRLAALLDHLRGRYRFVLIDSPPVMTMADARLIARRVDGVVVVARARQASRDALRRTVARLHDEGGNVLGVVLNAAADLERDAAAGYYGYGAPYEKQTQPA